MSSATRAVDVTTTSAAARPRLFHRRPKEGDPLTLATDRSPQEWKPAHRSCTSRKKMTRARDALGGTAPADAMDGRDKDDRFEARWARRASLVWSRPSPADRLPCLLRARRHHVPGAALPGTGLRGLLVLADQVAYRAPRRARLRRRLRVRVPAESGSEEAHGMKRHPSYTLTDDFDADFGVDQWPGPTPSSARYRRSTRTYSCTTRRRALGGTWSYLDITCARRQEGGGSPLATTTSALQWWNYHDAYTWCVIVLTASTRVSAGRTTVHGAVHYAVAYRRGARSTVAPAGQAVRWIVARDQVERISLIATGPRRPTRTRRAVRLW